MEQLRAVRSLALPDWCIAAGFLRNRVWDHLHGIAPARPPVDIDVIYFDASDPAGEREAGYEAQLSGILLVAVFALTAVAGTVLAWCLVALSAPSIRHPADRKAGRAPAAPAPAAPVPAAAVPGPAPAEPRPSLSVRRCARCSPVVPA